MSNKKSTSSIGVTIILIGVAILLVNFDILSLNMFWGITKLWPLVFIVIGLSILFKSVRYMGLVLWLIFIGAVISYSFINMDEKTWSFGQAVTLETYEETYKTLNIGNLDMKINTGNIDIKAQEKKLLVYTIPNEHMRPVIFDKSSFGIINLEIQEDDKNKMFLVKEKNHEVIIPKEGIWNLNIDAGISTGNINLADMAVNALDLDLGIGEYKVEIGKLSEGTYNIDIGIGEVVFIIPKEVGVKIYSDRGIASLSVPKDYIKEDQIYTSSNYETADNKIEIYVEIGIGSFKIK
jgi:hypothetical protein